MNVNEIVETYLTITDKHKKQTRIENKDVENIVYSYIDSIYSGSLNKDDLKERVKSLVKEVKESTLV